MARAYEVDASSMCDVLSGVPGVEDVSLEFDSRGNGVLRVRLRPDVDEDAVVGAAVAQLHRQFGVGLEGGRLRLTGPSGRTVVAVVEPHRRQPRRMPAAEPARELVVNGGLDAPVSVPVDVPVDVPADPAPAVPGLADLPGLADVPGLADEPGEQPVPERRSLDRRLSEPFLTAVPALPEPSTSSEIFSLPDRSPLPEVARPDDEAAAARDGRAGDDRAGDERSRDERAGNDEVPAGDGAPPPAAAETRLVLDRVEVATGRLELWATVRLRAGDETHTGTSSATATGTGAHRAVVAATARAAESALGGKVRLDVEAVDLLGVGSDQVGVVVVTLLTERGVDRVTGAALVRGDGRETLVRATLDALNRRTESLQQGRLSPPA